jgi:ribosome biogenesis GTPase
MKEGVIASHFGVAVVIEEASRERVLLRVKRKSGLVVGDSVFFDSRIQNIAARKNILARQTDHGIQEIAANLDLLGIVVAPLPRTPQSFIDLAIVAALHQGIRPVIIINKADLVEHAEFETSLRKIFGADISIFATSTTTNDGIEALKNFLNKHGRALFIGVSGSGKSSLVNTLVPDAGLDIGNLAPTDSHGKHVTTVSTLHHVDGGSELIDTPGIRDFRIASVQPVELAALFVGFAQWLKVPCRFRNCLHDHEPGCSIRQAVSDLHIEKSRYEIYLELLRASKQI